MSAHNSTSASTAMYSMFSTLAPLLMMQSSTGLKETLGKVLMIIILQIVMNFSEFITSLRKMFSPSQKIACQSLVIKLGSTHKDGQCASSDNTTEGLAVMYYLYTAASQERLAKYNVLVQQNQGTIKNYYGVHLENDQEVDAINHDGEHVFISSMLSETTITGANSSAIVTKQYTMKLRPGRNCSIYGVDKFVKECVRKYNDEIVNMVIGHTVFALDNFNAQTGLAKYKEILFDTTKTFDNMFFEGKETLVDRINDFQKNEARYKRLGIPYTLGLMFHGSPGCGKTSCIKAIAKMTSRHIVSISPNKIRKIEDLRELFFETIMNGLKMPLAKRLYVFEEIDCGQWKNIIRSRKLEPLLQKQNQQNHDQASMVEYMKMACLAMNKDKNNDGSGDDTALTSCIKPDITITLGEILELLDGISEMHGRMIIMTSNHPEQIDEALLRPGRIDLTFEFKKMRRCDVANMYKLWFDKEMPKDIYDQIRDYMFSQADIGNIFSRVSLDDIHSALVK